MTVILLCYRLVVGYTILPSLVHLELSPGKVRIFIKKKTRIFIYFELYSSITGVILQYHAKPRGQQR